MEDTTFKLPDGRLVLLRVHENAIYVYLNGDPWFGPLETAMARRSLLLPLPDDGGTIKAKMEYDDSFTATLNGRPLGAPGERVKKSGPAMRGNKQIRKVAVKMIMGGLFDLAAVVLIFLFKPDTTDAELSAAWDSAQTVAPVVGVVGFVLLSCGLWALKDDRIAGTPLSMAGFFYMCSFFVLFAMGEYWVAVGWAAFAMQMFGGAVASSQIRGAFLEREAFRRS